MEKRRAFLVRFLALPFAAAFLSRFLAACGSTETTATGCAAGLTATTSTGSHTHSIVITRAEIEAGVQKTYTTTVGNSHTHTVTVTAAQFSDLAANSDVVLTTSTDGAHDHQIALNCDV
ncbi:MAG TPA: hypothetical protein VM598_01415 [Bdellovibrionota bacterium]|nr:hypothetical protein [Bdellovibrionota bacterium]